MTERDLVSRAKAEGRKTLTEAESKQLLAAYGVPVVTERIARTVDQAIQAAHDLGWPVVLKGLGHRLTHKTEKGLVRLGLTNQDQIHQAAADMAQTAGADLEGYLVQPYLSGKREFVAGLFNDPLFGPIVMFGLGGVMTEILDDVVFRLAPLTEIWAQSMLDEIRANRMLDRFRGEPAADREGLVKTLLGLSRLSLELPEVAEVDINPLLITDTGQAVAVDALVVLGEPKPVGGSRPPADITEFAAMFHPKSIALVGASGQFRKWGYTLLVNVLAGGFKGRIHLVNPKAERIAGRPVYKTVADIPEPVDLAVVTVPAASVLDLLPGLAAKGIKRVIMITSGFAETGPAGRKLEEAMVALARELGILILGPNMMGICNPHHHFYCLYSHTRPQPGSIAFFSQSGNMGMQLLTFAEQQGLGIRAFIGSGNEAMVTTEDALDAFFVDRYTSTLLMYLESVKSGRRFFEAARKVSRKKPIVVLKGGRSEAGAHAAASHTGALAGSIRVFDAACRQAGIIVANRPMDLLDLSAAFSSLPLPSGPRVAIMTLGGGWGVVTADLCNEFQLQIPRLSSEILDLFDNILPPFWSRANPVDMVGVADPTVPLKIMESLVAWDGCDAVINLGVIGWKITLAGMISAAKTVDPDADHQQLNELIQFMEKYETDYIAFQVDLMKRFQKPILGVSLVTGADNRTVFEVAGQPYKGVFFKTPERAVKALAEMWQYVGWRKKETI
ncbi:MAG: acetate--CoA ligase family protein [Deltaproteobacteria bacterium]|nr:acetate--CoA ligase family protein [Deltaproteobacteria bacterium]